VRAAVPKHEGAPRVEWKLWSGEVGQQAEVRLMKTDELMMMNCNEICF